jgi:hypothetical protein
MPPKEYEAIRDSLVGRGKSLKEAKRIAAMTWNKRHKGDTNPWAHEGGDGAVDAKKERVKRLFKK